MSVMNMNSRMAMAEKLSVQQLQQAVQSGSLPAYIGIPLIEQKNKEKAQMAAAQGGQEKPPSVAASILQQADEQEQQERGIDRLPSNLPVMDGEEMGMANGGIIAFADAGQVTDPNAPPPTSMYGNIPAMSPEGKAAFDEYSKELKDLRGKGGSEREQAKNMAIFQAGLGMMGGTSPNPFANIAAGAMPAVTQYQSALKDIRKEDRDTLKQMLDLGVSKEQFLQKAQQMGVDLKKAQIAYDATIRAAGMRSAAEKQPRAPNASDIAIDFIEGQTKDYIAQGMDPAKAKIRAQRDHYALQAAAGQRANIGQQQVDINLINAENDAIQKNGAVINANRALGIAKNQGIPRDIQDAEIKLAEAESTARGTFRRGVIELRVGAGGGGTDSANPPPAGANPPPAGANPPPKIPLGSTPNADGTFNFPGNAKVPAGTYKMNADGSIIRVK